MERELLLTILSLAFAAVATWSAASLLACGGPALDTERARWWRLVAPLLAGALVVAFLLGWALQESDPADEWSAAPLVALAALAALIALRAAVRGVRAIRLAGRAAFPVATVGLWRCRRVVADAFRRAVSADALQAALAHEAAHARGRDPLRILLAQLAADLQWPIPGARRRLDAWLLALELRRDAEAVAAGADPCALAEAVLAAARLATDGDARAAAAAAAGDGRGVALRIRRLLDGATEPPPRAPLAPGWTLLGLLALLSASAAAGLAYGDALLRLLPGVGT